MSEWIEIKSGCQMPRNHQVVLAAVPGYQEVVVYRDSGMIQSWETHHGYPLLGVTHWKPLDWPGGQEIDGA